MGRYWLVRQPFWVRSLVAGAPFGLGMFVFLRFFENGWLGVAGGVGVGLLFGFLFTGVHDQMSRRFSRADGTLLSTDQFVEVVRAADDGRWPSDPNLHPPVEHLAGQRLRAGGSPWTVAAIMVAVISYAVFQAVTEDPIWWAFAGCMVPAAAWAVVRTRRQRHAAHTLMAQVHAN
ncbi:hypothetical protein ACWKSP_30725 [Micromonosporaceae bacterium Da 78-11]